MKSKILIASYDVLNWLKFISKVVMLPIIIEIGRSYEYIGQKF